MMRSTGLRRHGPARVPWRRARTRCSILAALSVAVLSLLSSGPAAAQLVRGFTPRFSQNGNGDITLIGNTLMTCPNGGACANAQGGAGGTVDDNDFNMVYVDIDADGTTFCSSRATLTLPASTTVLWAGLYWGGDSNNAARNTVRLATPASPAYATLTATQLDVSGTSYQGFIDVTALVLAGGNGSYTVANVHSTTGPNFYAGWSLVVVYRDNAAPPRNLVVFDGYAQVAPGASVTIPVSGFLTPPSGPVNTRLGVVAYEGDLGLVGDGFQLNGTALADAQNPAANFFNSTISNLGVLVSTKTPNYANQLGFDADLVSANGVLANGSINATIVLNSVGDRYYPGMVSFATDLYAPVIQGNGFVKTVTDLNGPPVIPGDVLEYTVSLTNTGQDAAVQTVLRDTLPANATYVAGSLSIASGPNTGAMTDAAGDDQMEYDALGHRVIARLGTGGNAALGGTLSPAATTSIKFRVRVNSPMLNGTPVSNQASLDFNAAQLGTAFSTRSDGDLVTPGFQPTTVNVVSGVTVSGWVYADGNHNLRRDAGESGVGVALWAKLVSSGSPGSAQQVVAVDPATGAYAFSHVDSGLYSIVLDDNATASDVVPALPASWIGTEAASGIRSNVTVTAADLANQNFGLWNGSRVDGTVFRDEGAGGGTANDGTRQGGESGLAGTRVALDAAACAGGECDSTLTDGAGAYSLWLPAAAVGSVTLLETNLAGLVSTGGGAGTTGGAYSRASDATVFNAAAGVIYSGVNFGDVPANQFAAGSAQTVIAGGVAFYAHRFVAGSVGSVTFSTVETPSPALAGWSLSLYRDLNCNGVLDSGEPLISAPVAVAAGQTLCLIAKHASPAGAAPGADELATLTASFSYTGAAPALSTSNQLGDLTTVTADGLVIVKSVDLATAKPGDFLTYTISYSNPSASALSTIVIRDATPPFTVFDSASCGVLGSGLSGCVVTAQPAVGSAGSLSWTLSGALSAGGSGTVTYRVRIP